MGLINSVDSSSSLDDEQSIRLISLFDNEEIGSETAQGAGSNFLPTIIRRLSVLPGFRGKPHPEPDAYERTLSKSFLVSADMAHSVNTNYAAKYEPEHKPEMNKGPVIKVNANARYVSRLFRVPSFSWLFLWAVRTCFGAALLPSNCSMGHDFWRETDLVIC